MTCIADTASINLTVAAGQISADLVVDPGAGLPPNLVTVNPQGVYVIGADGWIPLPTTLAFSSADAAAHTFVATTSADLRSFLGAGDKIRLVQSGVAAYFRVTAITVGQITLYGGGLYTLAATPVTLPYFSKAASPAGFTLDPVNWSEVFSSASDVVQNAPTNGVWYNVGSQKLDLPIGSWRLEYMANIYTQWSGGASNIDVYSTLSTANNSESDAEFSCGFNGYGTAGAVPGPPAMRSKPVTVAVKTSYFLNVKDTLGVTNIGIRGSFGKTVIRATLAYNT